MARSLILYDDACGLCKWLLALLLRWDRRARLQPVALQAAEADELLADMTEERRMASWHLIAPGGERYSAGAALPPLLRQLPGGRRPAAVFARFPRATDRGYRWVADHRTLLGKLVPARAKLRAASRVSGRLPQRVERA